MYAIAAKNISKAYFSGKEKNVVFQNLSLQVYEGEIIFIRGEYGSGRTTLLKMIAAMTPPNQGEINVLGKNLITIEGRSKWRLRNIGFITTENELIPYLNLIQQLLVGQDERDVDYSFFIREAKHILGMFDFNGEKLYYYPEQLTKLERLKLAIARTLMANPRLLLADELTNGLAEDESFYLYNLLVNYVRAKQLTLLVTGETETFHCYDQSYALHNGKLIDISIKQQIYH